MQNQTKAYIFAISAVLLWSTVATAFKTALTGMHFTSLLFISSLVSFILLSAILIGSGELQNAFNISIKSWLNSAVMGFLNPFLYYMILLKAYSILPAQIAQPLNYTWPVVLVFLSAPFLGHKITLKTILALLICFSGVLVISMQGKWNLDISNPFGVVLAAGSSIVWSVFWLLNMKDKRHETHKLFLNFFFGFVYIAIYILLFEKINIKDTTSFLASVYVGIFEMGITFVLWLTALRLSSSPEKISSFVFLSPFLSIFFIAFFLHETIHFSTVAGLCLIVAGIILSKTRLKSRS
jgi:drug/metabolite transporter (DMT)-like permease